MYRSRSRPASGLSSKTERNCKGPTGAEVRLCRLEEIDRAVKSWITADKKRGIKTVHVSVYDAKAMKTLGVPAIKGRATATKVKTAIDTLWKRLTPDYLILLGGDDIVPYFVVANPSYDPNGDDDKEVPTDNPYASSRRFELRPPLLICSPTAW
jgi:hypothetical protein